METKSRPVLKADGLLVLTAVIWGSAFVAQRVGMEHMGPLFFNGVRFALGAIVILPFALRGKIAGAGGKIIEGGSEEIPDDNEAPFPFGGVLAGLFLFGGATLQQVGLVYTTAGKAGFITGLYVVIVPLVGLLLGQKPGRGGMVGAVFAAVGLYLLSVTEAFQLAPGDFLELCGAFLWAGHVLILGRVSPGSDPMKLACVQYTVCAFLSLLTGVFTETCTWSGLVGSAVPILYGGLLSVGLAYTLQVVAQKKSPPVHAAIILSSEAMFAALAGWVVLGEVLSPRALCGCALMLLGMLLAQLWK